MLSFARVGQRVKCRFVFCLSFFLMQLCPSNALGTVLARRSDSERRQQDSLNAVFSSNWQGAVYALGVPRQIVTECANRQWRTYCKKERVDQIAIYTAYHYCLPGSGYFTREDYGTYRRYCLYVPTNGDSAYTKSLTKLGFIVDTTMTDEEAEYRERSGVLVVIGRITSSGRGLVPKFIREHIRAPYTFLCVREAMLK